MSSFTTDAGRCTTSPAAMRSTTVLGRAWIRRVGVGVDVDDDDDDDDDGVDDDDDGGGCGGGCEDAGVGSDEEFMDCDWL